jgi:hypothetical protein
LDFERCLALWALDLVVVCDLPGWRSFFVGYPFEEAGFVGCEGAWAGISPDVVLGVVGLVSHADPASSYISGGRSWLIFGGSGRLSLGGVDGNRVGL